VIFAEGRDVLLEILLPVGAQSSRSLMSELERGFKQIGRRPKDLQALGVGVGPGSYTGIRVGVAAAIGLTFPESLPLIGFCSLAGFINSTQGRFASVIDARQGGSYVLLQEKRGQNFIEHAPPRLFSRTELPPLLAEWPPLAGPHISYPDSTHLAHLIHQKLQSSSGKAPLELLYLHNPY